MRVHVHYAHLPVLRAAHVCVHVYSNAYFSSIMILQQSTTHCNTLQHTATHCTSLSLLPYYELYMCKYTCIIRRPSKKRFTGHFPQMKSVISGSFVERNLHHEGKKFVFFCEWATNDEVHLRKETSICWAHLRKETTGLICGKTLQNSWAHFQKETTVCWAHLRKETTSLWTLLWKNTSDCWAHLRKETCTIRVMRMCCFSVGYSTDSLFMSKVM